ncbi:hypothetical protein SEPCBS119000_002412 [Sporothrix epigloea]|uniref:Molybdopterin synthase sulfur carrier subunit n=1 Tax=Sporothrix epigloea TaxID=1892477 RepID=A0ABP0DG29_9PEZI
MSVPRPPAGHFNLLYFAAATAYTQKDYEALPAPMALGSLFAVLEERYPGMRSGVLDGSLVTINLAYVDVQEEGATAHIREGDEVAIIPPVSRYAKARLAVIVSPATSETVSVDGDPTDAANPIGIVPAAFDHAVSRTMCSLKSAMRLLPERLD